MSAVTTVLDALRNVDVLTRKDIGELLEAECLPSAIDTTLATMCRRGMIERLESGGYTLADEMTAERQAIIRKASERTQAPPPPVVSTGGRPRPETPDIEPEPDDGRTLNARILALLHRAGGPLNSSQIADLLPGAHVPSVYAACGKLALRRLLLKLERGRFELAPGVEVVEALDEPEPELEPMPEPAAEPVAVETPEPEPQPEPEPEPEPAPRVTTTAELVQRHAPQRTQDRYSASAELDGLTLRVEGTDAARVASVVAAALSAWARPA
jgi:hypothetical protein